MAPIQGFGRPSSDAREAVPCHAMLSHRDFRASGLSILTARLVDVRLSRRSFFLANRPSWPPRAAQPGKLLVGGSVMSSMAGNPYGVVASAAHARIRPPQLMASVLWQSLQAVWFLRADLGMARR